MESIEETIRKIVAAREHKHPKLSKDASSSLKRLAKQDTLSGLQVGRVLILNAYHAINGTKPLGSAHDFYVIYSKVVNKDEQVKLLFYQDISRFIINSYNYIERQVNLADMNLSFIDVVRDDIAEELNAKRFKPTDSDKTRTSSYFYTSYNGARDFYVYNTTMALEEIEVYHAIFKRVKALTKDRRLNNISEPRIFQNFNITLSKFNKRSQTFKKDHLASFKKINATDLLTKIKAPKVTATHDEIAGSVDAILHHMKQETSMELAQTIKDIEFYLFTSMKR